MMHIFIGFLCAALAGLGIGGGGLLVIWLVLACGMEQLTAQGVNLAFFLFSSGAAMLVHLMRRRLNFRLIAALALCGCLGALAGSALAKTADPAFMRAAFGWLLIASGTLALFKPQR